MNIKEYVRRTCALFAACVLFLTALKPAGMPVWGSEAEPQDTEEYASSTGTEENTDAISGSVEAADAEEKDIVTDTASAETPASPLTDTTEEGILTETPASPSADSTQEETPAETHADAATDGAEEAGPADPEPADAAGKEEPGEVETSDAAPIASCRFLMDAGGIDLSEETHVIGKYEDIVLLQFDTPEEAGAAYEKYAAMTDFIAADTPVAAADGAQEGAGNPMTEEDNPLTFLTEAPDHAAEGKTVVLIDTGADVEGAERVSFVGDDGADRNGHGTRMAKRILAEAPDVKIISVKALGDDGTGDSSAVYAAVIYAKEIGASFVNLSVSAVALPENSMIEHAVKEAVLAGICVTGAAGNNGRDAKYFVPGKISEAYIIGACDANGERLTSSNYGASVDYYVEASSTSEAAARFTGLMAAGKTPEKTALKEGTDSGPAEGSGRFETAETGLLSDGIYYTTVPYSKRVERQLSDTLGDAAGLTLDINLYHPSISNAANDTNGTSGIAGDMVRIWHDADGNPYYCYDLSASDEGSRSTKHLADVAASKVDKDRLAEVYTVAAQLTDNNFRLLIRNIDTIIPDIKITAYYKNGTRYEETVTIPAAAVRSYIKSGSEDALLLCRGIVQTYIWQRMNTPAWQRILKDAEVGGGWTVNKEGERIYVEPEHKDWSIPAKDVIDYDAMTGIGLGAAGGNPSVPDEISMGDEPGDADNPGKNGGQLLILTTITEGKLTLEKTSADSFTDGNDSYSLAGAEYTVYTDERCTQTAKDTDGNDAVLKTGADGKSGTVTLPAGTYWVKETKPPKGYLTDDAVREVALASGAEETLRVQDCAAMDPIGILLKKIDSETGKDVRRVER